LTEVALKCLQSVSDDEIRTAEATYEKSFIVDGSYAGFTRTRWPNRTRTSVVNAILSRLGVVPSVQMDPSSRYGRVLAANDKLAFSWTIDAVPVAVLSVNHFTIVPTGSGLFTVQRSKDHIYAASLSPIGLKLNFRRSQTLQPFASGTAGFLYFSKDVPVVAGAARFNFTFDFGGGMQIVRNSGRAITIGYKYQRISNGEFYGGFSIFR
jgi:hypothetical protein